MMIKHKIIIGIIFFLSVFLTLFLSINFQHTPMVSVVMPVYNREHLVAESIQSILNQTYKDFEFILVDDGSTDNTLQVLQKFQQQDKRIKIISHPNNQGVSTARNTAQNAAQGKYLLILDSDDIMYPSGMETLVTAMEENPSYHLLNANIRREKKNFTVSQTSSPYQISPQEGIFPVCMLFYSCYVNSGVIIRRDFIVKNQITYNPQYTIGEDYDYFLQCILAGAHMGTLQNVLTIVRRGHSSLITTFLRRTFIDTIAIKKKIYARFHISAPLKIYYSSKEKCQLMNTLLPANEKENIVDHQTLTTYFNKFCNPDNEKTLAIIHPRWEDTLILETAHLAYRWENGDAARYRKSGDKLFLYWYNWNKKETFIYDPEKNAYIFQSEK